MKVVITGKTGVGKTTILQDLNFPNTLYLDTLCKNCFYKRGHELFHLIVKAYGKDVVEGDHIDTKALGQKVLTSQDEMQKLSEIVRPFIVEYINALEGNWLIEMATYINYEDMFKHLFSKVVMIVRDNKLIINKFPHLQGKEIHTIGDKTIDCNFIIENNGEVNDAVKLLSTYLKSINFFPSA